jgi:hypothetical protein
MTAIGNAKYSCNEQCHFTKRDMIAVGFSDHGQGSITTSANPNWQYSLVIQKLFDEFGGQFEGHLTTDISIIRMSIDVFRLVVTTYLIENTRYSSPHNPKVVGSNPAPATKEST